MTSARPLVHLALLLAAAPAAAQDKSAEAHYEDGMRHYKDGNYLKAARSYVLAYESAKAPELAYNAARAFDKGERWSDARRYYDRWLEGTPSIEEREALSERLVKAAAAAAQAGDLDAAVGRQSLARELLVSPDPDLTFRLARFLERADRRDQARATYEQARTEGYADPEAIDQALARMEGGRRVGRVVFAGDVEDFRANIDGRNVAGIEAGREFELPPGSHKVILEKKGFRPWRGVVEVRPGQLTTVPFQLVPIPAAPVVRAEPRPEPTAPTPPPPRPGGSASAGPFSWPPPTTTWLAFGAGAAVASAGMIFGSLAAGAEQDLENCVRQDDRNCATSNVATELSERGASWQLRANVAYAGALLAAGVGAWLWLSDDGKGRRDVAPDLLDEDLSAWIGGGMAGLQCRF